MGVYVNLRYPAQYPRETGIIFLQQKISALIENNNFFVNDTYYQDGIARSERYKTMEVWFASEEDAGICLLKFGGPIYG